MHTHGICMWAQRVNKFKAPPWRCAKGPQPGQDVLGGIPSQLLRRPGPTLGEGQRACRAMYSSLLRQAYDVHHLHGR